MTRNVSCVLLGILSLGFFAGCVPYQSYDGLKSEFGKAKKINEDLTAKLNRLVQEISHIRGGDRLDDLTSENLRIRLERKDALIDELRRELTGLKENPLPAEAVLRFEQADVDAIGHDVGFDPVRGSIILSDEILTFNAGEATFRSQKARDTVDRLARLLQTKYAGNIFHIVGHTDNTPLVKTQKRWETNLRLGWERAYMVFKYLTNEHSFKENAFVLHSYGFLKPVDSLTQNTPEGRAQNRRVEIYRGGTEL